MLSITLVLSDDKTDGNDESVTPQEETNYATSFIINVPSLIQIPLTAKVRFKSDFIEISPSDMIDKDTYEIINFR